MALQASNFPTTKPELTLDFANSRCLDPRITFTRASTGTYVDERGILQTAPVNVARFDHNPATGESLGLLVEEPRTNLLLRSEEFDNASWSKSSSTVTANLTTSPSQATTADKLIEDGTTNEHYFRQTPVAYPTGATFSISIYVKSAERTSLRVRALDTVNSANGFFGSIDTATGTTAGSFVGTGTFTSATAVNAGNGWWRLTVIGIASSTSTSCILDVFLLPGNANSASNYAGNGTSGIYIWGAQLEAGAFATSYIPTTTAAATRSADVASITGTAFSGWYRQDEGTVYGEGSTFNTGASSCLVSIDDTTSSNRIQLRRSTSASTLRMVSSGGSIDANLTTGTALGTNKIATGISANNQNLVSNGVIATGITSITPMPTVTQAQIGNGPASNIFNGTIRRITYWRQRLPNSTLQTLTSS